jgi:hypothetical protein
VSSILFVESIIKLVKIIQSFLHLTWRAHQISYPKVIFSILLLKSWSRHSHNTCLVDHFMTVHEIRFHSLFFSLLNCLFRQENSWEGIHCSLNFWTGDILHFVERLSQHLSPFFQTFHNSILFLKVFVYCCIWFHSFLWRVN